MTPYPLLIPYSAAHGFIWAVNLYDRDQPRQPDAPNPAAHYAFVRTVDVCRTREAAERIVAEVMKPCT